MLLGKCTTMTRLASDRLDRLLTRRESVRVRVHMMCCCGCRTYASQLSALRFASRVASGQTDIDTSPAHD
ncbi:hypothetical protein PAN31108_00556 [Pandoraea anhela]|uniref:Zinc-finger domain-containing protein n=1 Tax=Pandoraea anhela TaxID=2508295 RepID=A0A5E4S2M4_9BURK|nr:zf-HC2 domain-containing protein [Pandoraea anhela]VVD69645.1 hypothetical protein PAN31108_00556 [Pandoraea anhela]